MEHSTQGGASVASPHAAGPGIGRRLVLGLLLLGVALATFAIWFQRQQTRRCLALYGSEAARRIQTAVRVELWEPQEPSAGGPAEVASAARTDISRAAGLVHLRRGLVEDANFDWQRAAGAGAPLDPAWDAAFAFYDTPASTVPETVLLLDFDPAGGTLHVAGRDRRVGLGRIEKGLRSWLEGLRTTKGL